MILMSRPLSCEGQYRRVWTEKDPLQSVRAVGRLLARWRSESSLHWVIDIVFHDNRQNGPQNFTMVWHIALRRIVPLLHRPAESLHFPNCPTECDCSRAKKNEAPEQAALKAKP